jgi:hypothetical protein
MSRGAKAILIVVAVIALLAIAGNIAFVRWDERRAAAFGFAVNEPETAIKQITQAAERKGTLVGSGIGVAIPSRTLTNVGSTQWTISPDGAIRGSAPERGLVVVLIPEMTDRKVAWNCKLEPEREFMRSTCTHAGQPVR